MTDLTLPWNLAALAPTVGWTDIAGILPVLILGATGALVLLLDLVPRETPGDESPAGKPALTFLSLLGTVVAGAVLCSRLATGEPPRTYFAGALQVDSFSLAMSLLIVIGAAFTLVGACDALRRRGLEHGEFHALVLFAAASMILFAESSSLIMVFLSLETLSMAVYVLTAFQRDAKRALEGALKYFVLGGLSSGFLLLGLVLLYGATRHTSLVEIAAVLQANPGRVDTALLAAALGLILVGLGFKVGAFPFHAWVPDAYEGALSVVTGFMAVTVKVASFAVLLRLVVLFGGKSAPFIGDGIPNALLAALSSLAALTMVVGNVAALTQTSVKRMLAYSAIAHTGYLLVGVVAALDAPTGGAARAGAGGSVLFYLFPYALMSLGAFLCLSHLGEGPEDRESLDSLRGLSQSRPGVALALLVIMVSFAGIPPTAGFWGKFYIFREAIGTGHWALALLGILTSIVSAYYYLGVVVAMYMRPGDEAGVEPGGHETRVGGRLAIAVAVIAVVLVGLFPETFFRLSLEYALR